MRIMKPAEQHRDLSLNTTRIPLPEHLHQQTITLWPVIRAVLATWAVGVWVMLVMLPGIEQISNMSTAMIHLPNVFIGLGLLGAIFMAYNLKSDGHMLWFLGVLLLIAGWM